VEFKEFTHGIKFVTVDSGASAVQNTAQLFQAGGRELWRPVQDPFNKFSQGHIERPDHFINSLRAILTV
jgi:hypothetical protein